LHLISDCLFDFGRENGIALVRREVGAVIRSLLVSALIRKSVNQNEALGYTE